MGRAKGQPHAIATASFEAVLGGRRGATGASERPDKELETALAALNSGDPDSAYLVLRGRRNTTGNDAATEQLMAALSATLADSQLEAWGSTMRGALERSGFKQSDRAHTLVSRKYSPIVHIWPDGEQYTDIPDDKYSTRATGFPGVTL